MATKRERQLIAKIRCIYRRWAQERQLTARLRRLYRRSIRVYNTAR